MSRAVSRRVLNVLLVVLLVAIVAPFVVYAAPWLVGAEASFIVLTASMTPAIEPGDVVIVGETEPSAIEEGDVITFTRADAETPVTHRVVGVTEANGDVAFETKGDANENPDEGLVPEANVIGTVVFTIPYIGYVIQFANSSYGFVALVVAPILLFVLNEIWMLVRAGRTPEQAARSSTETAADGSNVDSTTAAAASSAEPTESGSETASSEAVEPTTEPTGITLTATDLGLSAFVLFAFGLYAVYTVTVQLTPITVGVTVGVAATFVLVFALRLSLARSISDSASADEPVRSEQHTSTSGGESS